MRPARDHAFRRSSPDVHDMMVRTLLLGLALLGAASGAHAVNVAQAQQLARSSACFGCHAVERKRVGPALADVAARYRNDPKAADWLAKKIRQGGAGVWGQLPMPAHPAMSDSDARLLADWVLAGAPAR
jgi:cytochrome c